jgi:hypothetical protein
MSSAVACTNFNPGETMKNLRCSGLVILLGIHLITASSNISLKGTVSDGSQPLAGALVSLVSDPETNDTTDADGVFLIAVTATMEPYNFGVSRLPQYGLAGDVFTFSSGGDVQKGSLLLFSVNGRMAASISFENMPAGTHAVALPVLSPGFYIMQVTIDRYTKTGKLVHTRSQLFLSGMEGSREEGWTTGLWKKTTAPVDELKVEKTGYVTKTVPIDSYVQEGISIVLEEEGEVECPEFVVPAKMSFPANEKLPDPFKYIDGTRLERKADWPCLREQLVALLRFSHGSLPDDPGEVSATYSGGKLDVEVAVNGKTESFSASVRNVPSGEGPHPAIITLGGAMGISIPSGVAEISFPHGTIANESSRTGVFSRLYGSTDAGSMVMWAWGVGRLIDALELTDGHNIDPKRLGVTGCSRNGKGAMVCGAYEERIALTLPIEGGSGGISSWRIAKVENNNKSAHPDGCQTASQIIGESGWLSPEFDDFARGELDKLPVDAHTLAAICAPRGLYMVEGSQNSWNCNAANWTAAYAARMVYEALGVIDNIGHVMTDHNHCSGYGSAEQEAMQAFCDKFLLYKECASTEGFFYNDGSFDDLLDYERWIDWEAPELE